MLRLSRPVRRAGSVIAIALVLATVTAGCNVGRPPAAIVNGNAISAASLDDVLNAFASAVPVENRDESVLFGSGEGTFQTGAVAEVLTYMIRARLIIDVTRGRGIEITSEDRQQARPALDGDLGENHAALYEEMDGSTIGFLLESKAAEIALNADLAQDVSRDDEARAKFDANPGAYEQLCLSVISVATQEEMTQVQARLDAGEEFATVAKDVSIDPAGAEGGDQGCIPASQLPEQILADIVAAGPSGLAGPYEGESQVYVVKLNGSKPASFEESRELILQELTQELGEPGVQEVNTLLDDERRKAVVEVDPRYGRWSVFNGAVIPPIGPSSPTTTTSTP